MTYLTGKSTRPKRHLLGSKKKGFKKRSLPNACACGMLKAICNPGVFDPGI